MHLRHYQKKLVVYEESRKKIQKFLNAKSEKEIIFVRGATEGINLVAQAYGLNNFKKGDEIILSQMEHHSNIVPWQLLKDRIGIKINVLPINKEGDIDLKNFKGINIYLAQKKNTGTCRWLPICATYESGCKKLGC